MTITLDLTPDTEARLRQKAGSEGLDVKEYLQHSLDALPKVTATDYGRLFSRTLTDEEVQARLAALNSFDEFDEAEQRETGEHLVRALQEEPISFREWSA